MNTKLRMHPVHVVGDVVGQQIVVPSEYESGVFLPEPFASPDSFMLRIKHNRSIPGIALENDLLLLSNDNYPDNGCLSLIAVRGLHIVARMIREMDEYRIIFEIPQMKPIRIRNGDEYAIIGTVRQIIDGQNLPVVQEEYIGKDAYVSS